MGGLFDKDVGNALVEALYGTIKRDELRNRLVRASERYNPQDKRYRNIIKFAASADKDVLAEPDKDGNPIEEIFPINPRVLDPDKPQPGNIYHFDSGGLVPAIRLITGDKYGHSAIEVIPYTNGTRRVMSSESKK